MKLPKDFEKNTTCLTPKNKKYADRTDKTDKEEEKMNAPQRQTVSSSRGELTQHSLAGHEPSHQEGCEQ